MKRVAIITSSDMGYQGKREDLSGPAIREIVEKEGYQVVLMDCLLYTSRSAKKFIEILSIPGVLYTPGILLK